VVFTDQSSTGSFTTRSVADQGASYASGNNNVITSITGPGMTGKMNIASPSKQKDKVNGNN